jgi:hypothetical protein
LRGFSPALKARGFHEPRRHFDHSHRRANAKGEPTMQIVIRAWSTIDQPATDAERSPPRSEFGAEFAERNARASDTLPTEAACAKPSADS